MTDNFDDPNFDWEAWRDHLTRQVKYMFVVVVITELVVIATLVHFGSWFLIPMPTYALAMACYGRYALYLRDHV